jgi:hypothetical protein
MGQKVGKFFVDVGKAAAKGATSFVLGKVPFIGPIAANKLNSMYAKGGVVMGLAEGGTVPPGMKGQAINTPAQLIALVKKVPEIAEKHGLSPELIREEVAKAKQGEIQVKRRGGMMKKMGGDKVMVHSGGGGHGVSSFARGGKVLSVF